MSSVDFSLVRFSPVPEEVEAVNVAVLLWDRPPRLLLDSDFPRLAAITSRFDRSLLHAYLDHLLDQVIRSGEPSLGTSSQIQLSSRRKLFSPLSREAEQELEAAYLTKSSARREHRPRADAGQREALLDEFLTAGLSIPLSEIRRKIRPIEFLPTAVANRFFPNDGLRFGRVIAGRNDLLVIDAINRHTKIDVMERQSNQIGAGFHALQAVKNVLRREHRKTLYRSIVFFGAPPSFPPPRLGYIESSLRAVSDLTEEASHPTSDLMRVAQQASMDLC